MTTFYVKPLSYSTGNNDGTTEVDAWQGLSSVLWNGAAGVEVNAGDTLIASGTFSGEVVAPGVSGTEGNKVIIDLSDAFLSHPTHLCVSISADDYITILGGTFGGISSTSLYVLDIVASDHILIDGAYFRESSGSHLHDIRMWVGDVGGTKNVEVKNCTFNAPDSTYEGIRIASYSSAVANVFDDINIHHNIFNSTWIRMFYNNQTLALVTNDYRAINMKVTDNEFNYPYFNAIHTEGWGGANWNYVARNTIIGAGNKNALANAIQTNFTKHTIIEDNHISENAAQGTGDGNCIILDHLLLSSTIYPSDDLIVRRNYCHNATDTLATNGCGILVWNATNSQVYSNVCENATWGIRISNVASTGAVIYNNVMINNVGRGAGLTGSAPASIWMNNIIANNATYGMTYDGTSTKPTESYNNFYNNPDGDFVDVSIPSDQALDSTDVTGDPLLDSDYVPTIGSSCIEKGSKWWGVTARPVGFNGEPFSDWDIDIGVAQSLFSPHHPSNI